MHVMWKEWKVEKNGGKRSGCNVQVYAGGDKLLKWSMVRNIVIDGIYIVVLLHTYNHTQFSIQLTAIVTHTPFCVVGGAVSIPFIDYCMGKFYTLNHHLHLHTHTQTQIQAIFASYLSFGLASQCCLRRPISLCDCRDSSSCFSCFVNAIFTQSLLYQLFTLLCSIYT